MYYDDAFFVLVAERAAKRYGRNQEEIEDLRFAGTLSFLKARGRGLKKCFLTRRIRWDIAHAARGLRRAKRRLMPSLRLGLRPLAVGRHGASLWRRNEFGKREEPISPLPDPTHRMEIALLLERFSGRQRAVLALALEGLSQQEIARRLGCFQPSISHELREMRCRARQLVLKS